MDRHATLLLMVCVGTFGNSLINLFILYTLVSMT